MAVIHISEADAVRDAWFRAEVQQAIDDTRPDIASDEVEAHFAKRRAATLIHLAGNVE